MLILKRVLQSLSTILLLVFLCAGVVNAQETVTGVVTSADEGEPLPGVNITVQGTTIGTTTNVDGEYSLEVPEGRNVLIFSFVGFATQQIEINGRTEINVTLQTRVFAGDELVVVGYGTQREADLTGSIQRIKAADISKQPSLTATEALQGKVAGVNIIQNDAPGGSPTVIMRGLGTALGGRNPLYIVDGVPVDDINNISPSDIESMDFLKDASAASIYGLRAANGVIIVETKQGAEGVPQFTFDNYAGYTSVLNQPQMAGAQQYITYFNEENAAVGGFQLSQNQEYNTDWFDELLNVGYVINTTAAVSGGGENVNYYLSYNLNKEEGLLEGQEFWRQTLRNNNNYTLFDGFLTIDQNLSVSVSKENPKPIGAFNTAYRQSPLVPTFYPNGRYGQPFVNETTGQVTFRADPDETIGRLNTHGNPLTAIAFSNSQSNSVDLQGNVSVNLNITDYLTFTSRLGATRYYNDTRSFNPIRAAYIAGDPTRTVQQYIQNKEANPGSTTWANNSLFVSDTQTFRWNWDNFLNYSDSFGEHNIDATVGYSSEKTGIGQRMSGLAYDVPRQEQYWNLDLATDEYDKEVNHTNFTPTTLLSYFGRVQYNYDRRYYFTGTLRRDGSSQFANNEEFWELFPSVGLGWTISNEAFMEDNETINFLKLRASWGKLGNQNVPFNSTVILTNIGSGSQNYVFGPDQTLRFGASVGAPARDISWEIVEEYNIGADIELLDNRLTATADVYQKTTENLILQVNPLPNSPFEGSYFDQGAEVVNRGLELSLGWGDNLSEDFSYNIGTTFSYNTNEVTSVEPGFGGLTGGSLNNGQLTKRLEEGEPLGAWWMYEAIGVWQDQDEIDNNPSIGGALPGHLRYADLNDDGVIDERDKKFFGSYIPKYSYGINVGLNYKEFDFSMDAFGVGGNKVYDGLSNTRFGGENIREETFKERWTGAGSTNEHPGANRDAVASSYYLEDGSYLRINNITLGYTLSEVIDHVSQVRFYVSAQNPFMVTDYPGFTPELASNDDGAPYGQAGIELSAYPNTRTLLFGINIDF
jgi:TonB-linked SusC/RagA family outer membrane protein